MKKNKKGFTLVELIVSITLLALIGVSIGIYLNKVNKNREDTEYETYLNKVKSAANIYMSGNKSILNELESNRAYVIISLEELKNSGLIDSKLTDLSGSEDAGTEIKIHLDSNGSLIVDYPAINTNDFLNLTDVKLKINSGTQTVSCFDDTINTLKFGYISSDGILVPNYLSTTGAKANIKCNQEGNELSVDTNKVGTYSIKYDYLTKDGVWNSATRKIIVADAVPPEIGEIIVTPSGWTNGNKTYSTTAMDKDSGIGSYALGKDGCGLSYIASPKKPGETLTINGTATTNGNYYICVNDVSDNKISKSVTVSQIDKIAPKVSISSTQGSSYATSFTITATATDKPDNSVTDDSVSKIVAYQFTTSSTVPTNNWNSVGSPENDSPITKILKVNSNGTYYFWVKDAAGNVNKSSYININKIASIQTIDFNGEGLSSSYISGSKYISGIKEVISGSASNGTFSNAYISGSYLYYSGYGSSYSTGYDCSYSTSAIYDGYQCTGGYYCYYGGHLSNGMCIAGPVKWNTGVYSVESNSSFHVLGSCDCEYTQGGWYASGGCTDYGCSGNANYDRSKTIYGGGTETSYDKACKTQKTTSINVWGICDWQEDYDACQRYSQSYHCNVGSLSGSSCYVSDYCYKTQYRYYYTISYWI